MDIGGRDVPGDDHDGDVVRLAVLVEVFEAGVELDVCRVRWKSVLSDAMKLCYGGEVKWGFDAVLGGLETRCPLEPVESQHTRT